MRRTAWRSTPIIVKIAALSISLAACSSPDVGALVQAPCPAAPTPPVSLQAPPPAQDNQGRVKPYLQKVRDFLLTSPTGPTPPPNTAVSDTNGR